MPRKHFFFKEFNKVKESQLKYLTRKYVVYLIAIKIRNCHEWLLKLGSTNNFRRRISELKREYKFGKKAKLIGVIRTSRNKEIERRIQKSDNFVNKNKTIKIDDKLKREIYESNKKLSKTFFKLAKKEKIKKIRIVKVKRNIRKYIR